MEQISLVLAVATLVLGVFTLVAWWLGSEELLHPVGPFPPLSFDAAIAFSLIGIAILGRETRRTWLAWTAIIPVLIAALTLIGHALRIDLLLEWLPRLNGLHAQFQPSGRPNSVEAAGILLAALCCLWGITSRAAPAQRFVQALTGSLLSSVGACVMLGYATELPALYTLGGETAIAPLAALALTLSGTCLLLLAWRHSTRADGDAPTWCPMPAVIAGCALTLALWVGLQAREEADEARVTQLELERFATQANLLLDRQIDWVESLARRWSEAPPTASASAAAHAERQFTGESAALACTSISLINSRLRTIWAFPPAVSGAQADVDHNSAPPRRDALQEATLSAGRPTKVLEVQVAGARGQENGFVIYGPLSRTGENGGFVVAEYSYRTFFDRVAARLKLGAGYHVNVFNEGQLIFRNASSADGGRRIVQRTFPFANGRLRFTLEPTTTGRGQYLPGVVLAAGFGLSVLLGLGVHLARRARAGQRAAEQLNRRLSGENEERRRIEGRLKVSDERLRLALDSTQIGIFEWTVAVGHVYYSPGLWSFLDYEHVRMPPTVDTWQSLIHPDDLPAYRRRTESQLGGIAAFTEMEYRVRARGGDWRWVYARSKLVATTPEGRPARIIGTVQDISSRREAETALRQSQAEARKLSLVAAKTGSPVLIGSPDGKIEWVNEAFCRVMEYSPAEVIGRSPGQFMIGPETNLRTIVAVRTAIARGQGISTDLVSYSKSGRKYHLHLEIQPVRGANGELENFIAVETDITSRVETEHQLRRAKAEADEASRAKSEFLASMSHEIRTPMNGVIGMTSLLLETGLTPEQRDYVSTIRTSGEALLTIINDILDFSKIESGKMELDCTPFELSLCLEDALDLFALQAAAKKLELGYYIAPDVPSWVIGDVTRLRQVIVNLVNNAVKFTPSGSVSVEVQRIRRDADSPGWSPTQLILQFTVRDTGIGIPKDRVGRLFRAFGQVDSSTTRKYGGTGLGLAISQRLCELMGGVVRVESSPAEGTSFTFTIETSVAPASSSSGLSTTPEPLRGSWVLCVEDHPVTQSRLQQLIGQWGVDCVIVPDSAAALDVAAQRPRPPALLVVDVADSSSVLNPLEALSPIVCPRMLLVAFGQSTPSTCPDGQPCASTTKPLRTISFILGIVGLFQSVARGKKGGSQPLERAIAEEIPLEILLAEDNAVNQKVALRFLERLGYRADAVANGLEAVTTLQNRRYDLVLMDLQMPEMDGFEATRQIRRRLPAARQPKIVALTANAMQGDRELCFTAGMDDYISKPVKLHEIAEAIRRHFRKAEEVVAPALVN